MVKLALKHLEREIACLRFFLESLILAQDERWQRA